VPNPEALGPASLAVGQSVSSFSIFLPKFTDVRQANPKDETMIKDLRLGEFGAATVAIGVGLILSSISGQPAPAIVSVIMVLILVMLYEKAMKTS
jgi:hypothetical protein